MRNPFSEKIKNSVFVGDTIKMNLPPVSQAMDIYKTFFETQGNIYDQYDAFFDADPEVAGALDVKAIFVRKTLGGFLVVTGGDRTESEGKLQTKLNDFWRVLQPYAYDIAYKVLKYGNACYIKNMNGSTFSLDYLPMNMLTCLENQDLTANQIFKRGVYFTSEGTDYQKQYPASK